jgi:hypothetical protein
MDRDSKDEAPSKETQVVRLFVALNYRHGKLAFALSYMNGNEQKIFLGWIWGNQPPRAQMVATHTFLQVLADEEKDIKVELVMRSDYMRERLSMALSKTIKEQHEEYVRPSKEDNYPWKATNTLWAIYKKGFTVARKDQDRRILSNLERHLEELAFQYPSPLKGDTELVPQITAHDVSSFPSKSHEGVRTRQAFDEGEDVASS